MFIFIISKSAWIQDVMKARPEPIRLEIRNDRPSENFKFGIAGVQTYRVY
jgi:hypothetical protein